MPLNNGDVMRITCKFTWLSQDQMNVYHARAISASSELDATIVNDIAQKMNSAYGLISGGLDNRLSFDTISVYNLTAARFMGEVPWPSLTLGGNTTGKSVPAQAAALVRFPTATLGSQGRKFIGGMVDDLLDDDSAVQSAFRGALASFAASLLTGVAGADYSAYFGNWDGDLGVFRQWIRAIVNTYCATIGRRRPGVGS